MEGPKIMTVGKRYLFVLACSVFFLLIVYRLLLSFSFKPEISVGESNNVWNALKTASGQPLYTDPEKEPYEIFQYTPISQYPIIWLCKIFNKTDENYVYKIFSFGRLLNLIYNLLTLFFLFKILRDELNINTTAAVICLVLVFSSLTHLSYSIRPDSLSMLFTISAIYFFILYHKSENLTSLLAAAILPVLGFYSKQDSVAIIIPCVCFLVLNLRFKSAIKFIMSFFILFLVVASVFYFCYGNIFLESIFKGVQTGFKLSNAYWVYDRFLQLYNVLFATSLLAGLYCIVYFKKSSVEFFIGVTALFFLLVAIVTSLKSGSWVNYYMPFLLTGTICLFVGLRDILFASNSKTGSLLLNYFFVFCVLFIPLDQTIRRTLVYTSPYLKYWETRNEYQKAYLISKKIEKDIPRGKIFTTNCLVKTFLPLRSIFPNYEFYPVSKFNYRTFLLDPNKDQTIQAIVISSNEDISANSTLKRFQINTNNFQLYDNSNGIKIYKNKNEQFR